MEAEPQYSYFWPKHLAFSGVNVALNVAHMRTIFSESILKDKPKLKTRKIMSLFPHIAERLSWFCSLLCVLVTLISSWPVTCASMDMFS